MGGNYHRRARTGNSHDFNNDVWPRRRVRRLGAPHPLTTLDPKTHRWIHGVRAAGIHSREYAALPSWRSQAGRQTGRAPPSTRPGASAPARSDKELTGVLGEARIRNIARV